jgi:hypothetical protein
MRLGYVFGALLALPAAAQDNAGKVRLDEFVTTAAAEETIGVEQLSRARDTLALPPQSRNSEATRQPVAQLGSPGERPASTQVGRDQQPSAAGLPALTARGEGRPEPATPIGGADRCDPQRDDGERLALCRRVIERRANEFAVQRAPQVSPEAALLGLERTATSLADAARRDTSMRGAENAADADEKVNQELAAALAANRPPAPAPPSESPGDPAGATLADAIADLVVQIQARP